MADLNIAIAGLGTVGASVFKIIEEQSDLIRQRTNSNIKVTAVSSRSKGKDRGINLDAVNWLDNPMDIVNLSDVNLVIELIGGEDGVAYDLVKGSLLSGKHVVTANKALLAKHGKELFKIAEDNNVSLYFEAAVAGGIPIIKGIREGLSANKIKAVYGILNGTCNYILTEMANTKRDFAEVLKEAQDLGYAEADPSFDIDGIDAGHKLSLLTSLAFGCDVDFDAIAIKGIRDISLIDIEQALELGYKVKLLGITKQENGKVMQTIEPCLVKKQEVLASVDGSLNAVFVDGDFVGQSLFVGHGAGGYPTASSVVADVIDIARNIIINPMSLTIRDMQPQQKADINDRIGCYYIRLMVNDKAGVMADVTSILRDNNISMETMLQHGRSEKQSVPIIITTHETTDGAINKAVQKLSKLDTVTEDPYIMRIEEL